MSSTEAGGGASSSTEGQTAYNDLKRLIPSLAAELELLRTSLREHSLWLLRYGHGNSAPAQPAQAHTQAPATPLATTTTTTTTAAGVGAGAAASSPETASTTAQQQQQQQQQQQHNTSSPPPTGPPPAFTEASDPLPPAYSASDVPPYTGGFSTVSASTREEVRARRDQLTEWLREGEDVLREYSARYAQLAQELGMPQEDLLGTWHEAHPDNALPGYRQIEEREEFMVGGVGEVPPPYLGGRIGSGTGSGTGSADTGTGAGVGTGAETGAGATGATGAAAEGRESSAVGGSGDPSASTSSSNKQE